MKQSTVHIETDRVRKRHITKTEKEGTRRTFFHTVQQDIPSFFGTDPSVKSVP